MSRSSAKQRPRWTCICTPTVAGHDDTSEKCAYNLKVYMGGTKEQISRLEIVLANARDEASRMKSGFDTAQGELVQLKNYFGIQAGFNEGLICACGGPIFKFSDPKDKTRICPFCAARYIVSLKAGMGER